MSAIAATASPDQDRARTAEELRRELNAAHRREAATAEVMADGCVHVYGALRGRAMAGVHGDTTARVFCHEFRAELVSIAGVFRVFETLPAELAGRPVQAWLDGDKLLFGRIGG